ncbi:alkaline phosphatase [Trypanosoma conorhini]|uniref:Alkaline phosphatase n=1 Tax=Trypanosoma conorhini TaxID=83891 RepID=A0A3R7MFP1_9TRYP|nr:alkaline phosphatase [Trypanosoma conorhini]RNF14326.1 alkaline phosphatase [Trypanosoma conorhini]
MRTNPAKTALTALFLCSLSLLLPAAKAESRDLAQIVFVSCNRHDRDQGYWDVIAATVEHSEHVGEPKKPPKRDTGGCAANPPVDALVWLGDAVYGDNFSFLRGCYPNDDLELVRSKFVHQRNAPEYVAFRQTCVRQRTAAATRDDEEERQCVMGVWDDHDLGKNDGGAEYAGKDVTQQFFLDFLGVAKNSPRRKQKGVYNFEAIPFRALDPTSDMNSPRSTALKELQRLYDHAACFLLLDVRYFRDPANATRSGDMLGEEQWKWLEERLRDDVAGQNPATGRERCALTVVGSGVQLIMDEKVSESWGAFPRSRERLFSLLRLYNSERVMFISGDVHLGEIGMDASCDATAVLGYPILEATSSGLTHSTAEILGLATIFETLFPSPRRVGAYVERNFGVLRLTTDPEALLAALQSKDKAQRQQVERYVNVSVSIHSLPQHGKAVLQLTLPLSVFTLRGGAGDSSARPARSTSAVRPTCEKPSKGSIKNGGAAPQPYHSSTPTPAFTYMIRFLQRHVWPQRTLLQVTATVLRIVGLLVVAAMMIFLCLKICVPRWRSKKKAKTV